MVLTELIIESRELLRGKHIVIPLIGIIAQRGHPDIEQEIAILSRLDQHLWAVRGKVPHLLTIHDENSILPLLHQQIDILMGSRLLGREILLTPQDHIMDCMIEDIEEVMKTLPAMCTGDIALHKLDTAIPRCGGMRLEVIIVTDA